MPRQKFRSNIECVVSIVANAVGLGNVWRFPYLCYKNGGAAFFIPYTIMLICAAMPILGLEISWGQYARSNSYKAWDLCPLLGGTSIAGAMTVMVITTYYAVLAAYGLFYVFMSLYSLKSISYPIWKGCNHNWNTQMCLEAGGIRAMIRNKTLFRSAFDFDSSQFFNNLVAKDSGNLREFGYPNWIILIALFIVWSIVLIVLIEGISSMGKANYFFCLFPYFCILFLMIGAVQQEGAAQGILTYLLPDFSKLLELQVWIDAGQQIFFSLSICQSVMLTLSSFNSLEEPCLTNTVIVTFINCLTSFWIGFPIFCIIGHLAYVTNLSIDDLMSTGPSLVFIVYPSALNVIPGSAIWGCLFFTMLISVGLGTVVSYTESVIVLIFENMNCIYTKKSKFKYRCLIIFIYFLLGMAYTCSGGMEFLTIIDNNVSAINGFIIGIFECFGICFLYGYSNFESKLKKMVGTKINIYWKITWKYLTPLVLAFYSIIWIANRIINRSEGPFWGITIGNLVTASTLMPIPLVFLYKLIQHPNGISCQAIKDSKMPQNVWIPDIENFQDKPSRVVNI